MSAVPNVAWRGLRLANEGDVPRSTDEPGTFVRTVRAVDGAVSIFWRWATIIAVILGSGITVGVTITQNREVVKRLDKIDDANQKNTADVTELKADARARDRDDEKRARNDEVMRERVQNVQTDLNAIKLFLSKINGGVQWAEQPAKRQ